MSVKSYALTTRQRFIDFQELSNLSSADNTVIDILIDQVTEFIENYVGRRIKKTTYTQELYDGDGSEYLFLKNYPVISTESLDLDKRSATDNEDDWEDIDAEDYFVTYTGGIIEYASGRKFQNLPKHYRVTYTAGYDFDNVTTFLSDTEAGDLEYVAWKLIAGAWNRRRGDSSVQSESIGDYSVTYRKTVMEDSEMKSILDKYSSLSGYGVRS